MCSTPTAIYQGTEDPIYGGVVKFASQARTTGARVELKIRSENPSVMLTLIMSAFGLVLLVAAANTTNRHAS